MADTAGARDSSTISGNQGGSDETSASKTKKSKQSPRKRVSQACDRCRSRKDKCDGEKPACSTCLNNGRECSYDANVKKRGLPEGYVRGLEKLWGLAIRESGHIETDMLGIVADANHLKLWNDEVNTENLVGTWRKSQLSKELETLLSSLEINPEAGKRKRVDSEAQATKKSIVEILTVGAVQRRNNAGAGLDSAWFDKPLDVAPPHEAQPVLDLAPHTPVANLTPSDPSTILTPSYFHGRSSSTPVPVPHMPDLPSETWHLLDVYFSYTHTWFPIIEKHDLLRTSYHYSRNQGSASGSGEHAALWATIAYAKFQHRAINNIPRAQGAVRDAVWTAERMYSQARALVPNEEGNLDLGHIQALLILTLANMGTDHFGRAWSLIGQAVRAAIDKGLDQRPNHDQNVFRAKSRAKNLFFGCFALDTIIAARLSRRPHLRAEDLDSIGLIDEEGLEEWDPWTDCLSVRKESSGSSRIPASILSTFNRFIQVLRILNEAICSKGRSNSLHVGAGLLEKLHTWSQAQPSPVPFDYSTPSIEQYQSLLPHHHHLHTAYFTTLAKSQLLVHHGARETVNLEPCTRSTRKVVELLKNHHQSYGLLIVPPTYEYFVKSAYDIISEVQGSIDNTHIVLDDWRHSLDNCLDSLEPAWPVFEKLKSLSSDRSPLQSRRKSEVALDLITGISSVEMPQSLSYLEMSSAHNPHLSMSQTETSRTRTTSQSMKASQRSPKRTFSHSSGNGLPMPPSDYQDASVFRRGTRPPSSSTTGLTNLEISNVFQPPSQNQPSSIDPRLQDYCSATEADTDPLANEFAALDAMEWTGNWDQSLLNLGFTDRDNMNQDFYAFCQEPDPLHPDNIFRQLAASSNAEATNMFDSSAFGGTHVGLGTFGSIEASVDETEGIEAGQILQSLSLPRTA